MFFVHRIIIKVSDDMQTSIQRYTDMIQAEKRFHSIIAGDIDSDSISFEQVMVTNEEGIVLMSRVMRPVAPQA